mmetsp:Transcript_168501/g.541516  ORF Transcript_168501/g.541516 Transcript_168501/m.541516 type:complete len:256 (+) Transcript_168501:128-895(+)
MFPAIASRVLVALVVALLATSGCDCMETDEAFVIVGDDGLEAQIVSSASRQRHIRVQVCKTTPEEGAAPVQLSWQDTIDGLRGESPAMRSLLSRALREMPFEAFFWECPPVSRSTAEGRLFEFVVLPAPHLEAIHADPGPFAEHLDGLRGQAVSQAFANLGGDSTLVSPAQASEDIEAYTHVANFFRRAPPAQQDQQWRELGQALAQRLAHSPPGTNTWVSTEGSGVYWLHMRLDPKPKYYHFAEYRNPKHGDEF